MLNGQLYSVPRTVVKLPHGHENLRRRFRRRGRLLRRANGARGTRGHLHRPRRSPPGHADARADGQRTARRVPHQASSRRARRECRPCRLRDLRGQDLQQPRSAHAAQHGFRESRRGADAAERRGQRPPDRRGHRPRPRARRCDLRGNRSRRARRRPADGRASADRVRREHRRRLASLGPRGHDGHALPGGGHRVGAGGQCLGAAVGKVHLSRAVRRVHRRRASAHRPALVRP